MNDPWNGEKYPVAWMYIEGLAGDPSRNAIKSKTITCRTPEQAAEVARLLRAALWTGRNP